MEFSEYVMAKKWLNMVKEMILKVSLYFYKLKSDGIKVKKGLK